MVEDVGRRVVVDVSLFVYSCVNLGSNNTLLTNGREYSTLKIKCTRDFFYGLEKIIQLAVLNIFKMNPELKT